LGSNDDDDNDQDDDEEEEDDELEFIPSAAEIAREEKELPLMMLGAKIIDLFKLHLHECRPFEQAHAVQYCEGKA
jgi:hypothetical protein